MKKPNFFIIGAPKSGTTALASYLAKHPNVFMAVPKEPHHYASDLATNFEYKNKDKYLSLFEQARPCHYAVGEASPMYLYSKEAVANILAEISDAKFIAMLRNPVEMAAALHDQMVFNGRETEKDFKKAWALQDARRNGNHLPLFCEEPKVLLYRDVCSIGEQYERASRIIPKSNLLPIIFDDFKKNTRAVWIEVLTFLGVQDDGRVDFPVVNAAKTRRSFLLRRIYDAYSKARTVIGFAGFGTGLFQTIDAWNMKYRPRPPLDPAFVSELKSVFSDDIARLENCLGRDLSEWK